MKTNQIRRKVISYFVLITSVIGLLFTAFSFLFAYAVEDTLFELLLLDEKQTVLAQLANGEAPKPNLEFIHFYHSEQALPETIKLILDDEPERVEFAAPDGKHYHLMALSQGYLVAEVSDHLVVRKLKGEMLSILLVLVAFGLLIAVLLAFMSLALAKKLVQPLDTLMDIVENAPIEKLPTQFAQQFKDDEIGRFASTLEAALARIRAFIAREQEFTRDVSHELRTPLTVSKGALSLLQNTPLNDLQQSYLARVQAANEQMEQSIEGLLVLAREAHLTAQPTRLLPIVERIVLQHHELIANKPIELAVSVAHGVTLNVNRDVLTLLLTNLVKNAFSHVERGLIDIGYENGMLYVQDHGNGIAAELIEQIFEAGVKGQHSTGSGLGLAIVKRICDKLDYKLTLNSDEHGTRVAISVPKTA
jgi:signal transduction histidine kinase